MTMLLNLKACTYFSISLLITWRLSTLRIFGITTEIMSSASSSPKYRAVLRRMHARTQVPDQLLCTTIACAQLKVDIISFSKTKHILCSLFCFYYWLIIQDTSVHCTVVLREHLLGPANIPHACTAHLKPHGNECFPSQCKCCKHWHWEYD